MKITSFLSLLATGLLVASTCAAAEPFAIEVVDEATGRGVPLVELRTTASVTYYTDSAGIAAIDDAALLGRKIWFGVRSFGYEFAADGFGLRGRALDVQSGKSVQLKIKRTNFAERLYRVTGEGIYRDTLLAGRESPIREPLLNSQVVGQDSVQPVIYRDQLYLFWGDTSRQAYPLGLFAMAGATAKLPQQGGLDPAVGVDLNYFVDKDGFARGMAPLDAPGPVWVEGVYTVNDDTGEQRMLGHYSRMESLEKRVERGVMLFDDESQTFKKVKEVPLDAPLATTGKPFRVNVDGVDYIYFADPYPCVRVKADWQSVQDLSQFEGLTPLKPGTRFREDKTQLQRDKNGKLIFTWKRGTPPLTPKQLRSLIGSGEMKADESLMRLVDVEADKPILAHAASVQWNEYRKKYAMIVTEIEGRSMLGEVWYAESAKPEGPWHKALKVATHHMAPSGGADKQAMNMDFYNPCQHPYFAQDGGRLIYFEGTYTNSFSGYAAPTPRYEYNQLMYRLDLADERLRGL
jgi:hypothetical protein